MGDIHGAWKALVQCLERAGFDYQTDQLIQLGDVADGHADVYRCVEELLRIKNLIAIRGNHDEWFAEYINTGVHPDEWQQGGSGTAGSYLRLTGKDNGLNPADIPATHQAFFRQQHLYYIDEQNNCFVHAGFNRQQPFKGQPSDIYTWDRQLWQAALSCKGGRLGMKTSFTEIFIGHTSTTKWNVDQPMHACNIWNMDTGAGHNGRLTIMDVATKQYWQSDKVTILYGPVMKG